MKSVYNYRDPIDYISDFIEYQKGKDESFSVRKWSKVMELRSPLVLLDIIQRKKKLKGKTMGVLLDHLPIDNTEKMYFQAITERSQSNEPEKIKMYDLLIKELRPYDIENYTCYRDQPESDMDLFSHWIYMAILSMTNLNDFKFTADNIMEKLIVDLDQELVEDSLFKLFEHGLLKRNADGKIECGFSTYTSKTDIRDKSVADYYRLVCDLAKNAIEISLDQREFQCFTVAIPEDKMPLAKEIIRKARAQIVSLGSEDRSKNDTVYQGNLMFFPLTK